MTRSVIQGALNGRVVAFTPAGLAGEARDACAAGARSLHVHAYDEDGRESVSADAVAAAVGAVRAACPGVELGVSTGAWITDDVAAAIAAWRDPLPDMASVNLSEPMSLEVVQALRARGIAVEAGLFGVEDVGRLVATGHAEVFRRVLVEVHGPADEQPAAALRVHAALTGVAPAVPRLLHGSGAATWAVLRAAFVHGLDVRIGLEDTDVLPDGTPVSGNGALVAAAVALRDGPP